MENKINNCINDTLGYSGRVVIKLQKNGKTIKTMTQHNNGTNNFFKNILSSIIGNPNNANMPNFLNASSNNGEDSFGTPILKYYPSLTGKSLNSITTNVTDTVTNTTTEITTWQVTFTSYIPYSALTSSNIEIKKLGLFSNPPTDSNSLLAYIILGGDVVSSEPADWATNYMYYYIRTINSTGAYIYTLNTSSTWYDNKTYTKSAPVTLSSGYSLLIEWYMTISN